MKRTSLLLLMPLVLIGCSRDADIVSHNLSYDADSFKINRRVVFYNGITDNYILVVEGLCSVGNADKQGEVSITCKTGPDSYKKHFLGLSDNVTYFVEQLDESKESMYHYKVIFKPTSVIPDIEVR